MPNIKPRCGYLACDPVVGQCLGFCEQLHRVDTSQLTDNRTVMYAGNVPMPIEYAGDEPDDEDGPPEMLATVIVLTGVCVVLGLFIAGWLS